MEKDDTVPGDDNVDEIDEDLDGDQDDDLDDDDEDGDDDDEDDENAAAADDLDDLAPAQEPGRPVEAESLAPAPAAPVQPVVVAEAATDVDLEPVEAAGLIDDLLGSGVILLPFIMNPAKIGGVTEGIDRAINGATFVAKWQGVKQVGDLTVPLVDTFLDRAKASQDPATLKVNAKSHGPVAANIAVQAIEVKSILQMRTMGEAVAHLDAKKLGDGGRLAKLREKLGKFAESPMGQALLAMLLKQLAGGIVR